MGYLLDIIYGRQLWLAYDKLTIGVTEDEAQYLVNSCQVKGFVRGHLAPYIGLRVGGSRVITDTKDPDFGDLAKVSEKCGFRIFVAIE